MKKYLDKRYAKKFLITGGIFYAISFSLNFVTALSVYGKVDECLDKTAKCTLGIEQTIGKIAMVIGYAGIGIFFIGLILLLVVWAKSKRQ